MGSSLRRKHFICGADGGIKTYKVCSAAPSPANLIGFAVLPGIFYI